MTQRETPTLHTERLIIRAHEPRDFEALAEMWALPEVVKHISGTPSTRAQSWNRFLTYHGMWKLLGIGYWAIEEKATGTYLGDMGFADFKRDIAPSLEGKIEMGWVLHPKAHGRGLAVEALNRMMEWARENLPQKVIYCIISPENTASLRVAEKLGFRELTRTTFTGLPTVMFEKDL